jgi:type IV pilus assembly protein PilO
MMPTAKQMRDSLHNLWRTVQTMDRDAPLAWPRWLRHLVHVVVCAVVGSLLWALYLSADHQALKLAEVAHERLRAEFSAKLLRAAPWSQLQSLHALQRQRLLSLEKQLPGSREMDLLLLDMSRASQDRQLRIELLRPAKLTPQPHYAQQRIALRVVGGYQDLADFAADLAGLEWLLSMQSFTLLPAQDGALVMEAVVRTLRPLETTPNTLSKPTARRDAS